MTTAAKATELADHYAQIAREVLEQHPELIEQLSDPSSRAAAVWDFATYMVRHPAWDRRADAERVRVFGSHDETFIFIFGRSARTEQWFGATGDFFGYSNISVHDMEFGGYPEMSPDDAAAWLATCKKPEGK